MKWDDLSWINWRINNDAEDATFHEREDEIDGNRETKKVDLDRVMFQEYTQLEIGTVYARGTLTIAGSKITIRHILNSIHHWNFHYGDHVFFEGLTHRYTHGNQNDIDSYLHIRVDLVLGS